jgi:hypothetical protein
MKIFQLPQFAWRKFLFGRISSNVEIDKYAFIEECKAVYIGTGCRV